MTAPTLREWLREEPFTLAMSSGFFGFYAHAGALAALLDAGLLPAGLSGSSAGALVTGLYAGGVSIDGMRDTLTRLRRQDFWDPSPGLGLLAGKRFRALLSALVGPRDACASVVPYVASVYDLRARRTRTLREGPLATVVHASCALPGLFHPVRMGDDLFSDGGIADRAGIAGVAEGTRTLHHHLTARSPWRRAGSASIAPPCRARTVSVGIEGITRVNPFALERGMRAYHEGSKGMRRALDQVVSGPYLTVR
jgi:NTE family protein